MYCGCPPVKVTDWVANLSAAQAAAGEAVPPRPGVPSFPGLVLVLFYVRALLGSV